MSMSAPVHAQLRDAGETLAGRIEGGEYAALTSDQRFDLRQLSLSMVGWADLFETQLAEGSGIRFREGARLHIEITGGGGGGGAPCRARLSLLRRVSRIIMRPLRRKVPA